MYIIRCFNPETYTMVKNLIPENVKISIFNSYHKGYIEHLEYLLKSWDVVIEYPRGMEEEVAWVVGRVSSRFLQKLKIEMMDTIYRPKYISEVLVIGGGYNE